MKLTGFAVAGFLGCTAALPQFAPPAWGASSVPASSVTPSATPSGSAVPFEKRQFAPAWGASSVPASSVTPSATPSGSAVPFY